MPRRTRRTMLVAVGGAITLAGCVDSGDETTDTRPVGSEQPSTTVADDGSATADAVSPTTREGLDLREANVVAVEWDGAPGGQVEFAVTLYHDDDGEDGYVDWWQVETLDGERVGRRDLLHAHGTRAFTRSDRVAVPAVADCVSVRGHDQTHEYGGRAMLVDLVAGETMAVEQGPDPREFSAEDCP